MPKPHTQDRTHIKIDLLETLIMKEVFGPDSIPIERVQNWFSTDEQNLAREIIEEMHENRDCPLKYVIGNHSRIWLRDKDEAEEFLEDLRENPPWYDQ